MDGHDIDDRQSRTDLFDVPPEESPSPTSRSERWYRTLDVWVLSPLRVAMTDWRMPVGATILTAFVVLGTVGVRLISAPEVSEAPVYTGAFRGGIGAITTSGGWIDIVSLSLGETGFTLPWVALSLPLGTDRFGQDIARGLVHGTPAMLKMALAGAVFATGVALLVGTVAGYRGGVIDTVLMTITDIVMTIPALPLIVLLAAVYQPSDPFVIGVLLAIDNWPGLARALRSQVLTIRTESYVEAARAMGLSPGTVLRRDVIPQLMPYTLINAANAARAVIFESVALYFLGLLPIGSTFNWGVMMNQAYQAGALSNVDRAGHWLFAPMCLLVVFSFGLIVFSQGLDRVFNPQLRARHSKAVGYDDETGVSTGD
ncbi:ABC transporter permease [Halocatena halophila]|uniref:ABC transporter permease n=1 Tax=Halocatena halophila TaxID=2814576 RepID=UPI002ED630D2